MDSVEHGWDKKLGGLCYVRTLAAAVAFSIGIALGSLQLQ